VAASAENERSLSFGLTGPANLVSEGAEQSEPNPYEIARIGQAPTGQQENGQPEGGAEAAWWGKAFLKACPLH
jgi:hypothetical protein